jgi:Tfp pilus assembly protein PilN
MNHAPALVLNLATRPARNRKFYNLARTVLAAVCLVLLGLTAYTMIRFGLQSGQLKAFLAEAERLRSAAAQEERRLSAEVGREKAAKQAEIDAVNRIIFQKSFSWTGFFAQLEASLPDSVFITAPLLPNFSGDRTITLKMRVVSAGIDDLIVFLNNLNARKFTYKFENESREEGGRLVSDISVSYERVI